MNVGVILLSCFVMATSAVEFEALNRLHSKTPASVQAATVTDMLKRVVGDRATEFTIKVSSDLSKSNKDAFQIQTVNSNVEITGTTGVAAAMGVYYYLKTYCDSQFTWAGENINLPSPLPVLTKPVLINVLDKFRYYQNVCTVSYSSPFWNWTRWERHLDWMALNGINLPLAFTGQEAIFQRLYMNMGFSNQDMEDFFGGPAFLAWARMGNIEGWGGPLPQAWIIQKLVLQHKILKRMRNFGMIPVLPAFAGHVPAAMVRLYPKANITRLGTWSNFNTTYSATYLLDFSDPLFAELGAKFIQLMETEFGVDHIYNADTFNEMQPKSNLPEYLSAAGKAVFSGMVKADPDAVWLMQGWLFLDTGFWKGPQVNALVNSVPQGRMIILDLQSELRPQYLRTKSYYGQPFIWCMLHNFGGTMEMFGPIESINQGPYLGRHFTDNSTMVGLGLTMEGIFQNEIIYEFMMENAWIPGPRNITAWISSYAKQRYGYTNNDIDTAWQILKGSVYNYTHTESFHGKTGFVKRPRVKPRVTVPLWYDPKQLFQAWEHLLLGADQFSPNELFLYDLVDVSRNSLQVISLVFYSDLINAYQNNNTQAVKAAGQKMVDLLKDMETLLASDRHFLLGNWISDAVAYGSDMQEIFLLQNNARNQITIWGPRGEIVDYASKQWSGLFKDYYVPRWQFFSDWLVQVIQNGTQFDNEKFKEAVFNQVELPFTLGLGLYPTHPKGDSVAIAKKLHDKYKNVTRAELFTNFKLTSHKQQQPMSPFSWQQGRVEEFSDPVKQHVDKDVLIEEEFVERLTFTSGRKEEVVFEEVGVKERNVIA